MKRCEYCGNLVSDDKILCPGCGSRLPESNEAKFKTDKKLHKEEEDEDYDDSLDDDDDDDDESDDGEGGKPKEKPSCLGCIVTIFVIFYLVCIFGDLISDLISIFF